MKKYLFLLLYLPFLSFAQANSIEFQAPQTYHLIIEGFDWGPAANKVVIKMNQSIKEVNASDFEIYVNRSSDIGEIPAGHKAGKRSVILGYPSDEFGNRVTEGSYATLVLAVSPVMPLGSPIQYMRTGSRGGNFWIDYQMTILDTKTGNIWNEESGRSRPIVDDFALEGKFTKDNTTLTFAAFTPKSSPEKAPLIIWLHGGGEGGSDPTIALMGNKAFNYASPEIQMLFGGAYVLVPQAPTFWMQAAEGMTRGQTNDIYNEALFGLIQDYVAKNPKIDPTRIYVGGCSNGGYMSLKLILEHPDYFAAGFISALAYGNEFISDSQLQKIKNVPMWFIHSKDDQTTKPADTVVPLFDRLKKAGAKNVHFSFYDHVTDITGFYGGDDYYYSGHWSWIYSHSNMARTELDGSPVLLDGRPVTIMEWMAAQRKKK
ncbi:prolyl oligopeptidase family serine peptidase [Algoriphagus marinus]|uniref:prolyl oligopeptidase family serine peptidase n=1 Tax=Algoriphagus marinus TaxID=1925762 RepID=UPI00094BAB6C|nr:prolyl oligopeptidase family serine peptidase [Algoriphagus marinus]